MTTIDNIYIYVAVINIFVILNARDLREREGLMSHWILSIQDIYIYRCYIITQTSTLLANIGWLKPCARVSVLCLCENVTVNFTTILALLVSYVWGGGGYRDKQDYEASFLYINPVPTRTMG